MLNGKLAGRYQYIYLYYRQFMDVILGFEDAFPYIFHYLFVCVLEVGGGVTKNIVNTVKGEMSIKTSLWSCKNVGSCEKLWSCGSCENNSPCIPSG